MLNNDQCIVQVRAKSDYYNVVRVICKIPYLYIYFILLSPPDEYKRDPQNGFTSRREKLWDNGEMPFEIDDDLGKDTAIKVLHACLDKLPDENYHQPKRTL